ncbi:MAG TPA: hypothetical protein VMF08_21690 [Candidatus Sulfotelmatobacter sp.]|nr:hypothetical protein [Candidatus Sulfotelmatobacter sp.]
MWPFSNKKKASEPAVSLAQALELLAAIGIRPRPQISQDDLLFSLGGTMDSPVDWTGLLCVLGGEVERGNFERISDDIWHVDAECIYDDGDYVRLVERFAILTKGVLPLKNIRDHVLVDEGEAWVEFELDGKTVRWDLEVSDDWMAPELYSNLQALVSQRSAKKFFIIALGQDSLISFGDAAMKQRLSELTSLEFDWE